jgi:hypothetical protein
MAAKERRNHATLYLGSNRSGSGGKCGSGSVEASHSFTQASDHPVAGAFSARLKEVGCP